MVLIYCENVHIRTQHLGDFRLTEQTIIDNFVWQTKMLAAHHVEQIIVCNSRQHGILSMLCCPDV